MFIKLASKQHLPLFWGTVAMLLLAFGNASEKAEQEGNPPLAYNLPLFSGYAPV